MRELDAASWDSLPGLDAYYRRPYVEAAALLDGGRPFLLEHEGTLFAGVERDDPARDVVTPYGYGGPTGDGGFWAAYDEWARERGLVSTFVRFHPLYANHRGAPIHVEPLAPTVAWRLEPDRDLLAGLHFKHRNKVRKAENAGATVTQHDGLGAFVPLYEDTMRRLDADDSYFFEPAYWERLAELPLVRFDAEIEGEVVASALCLATPPWLHYHLSGTTDPGRSTGASTLVLLDAARWAQANGYERFHLGGGLEGKADSLHHFKARFDPEGLVDAAVGKAIHDEDEYRRLSGGEASYDGFFPAYRATVRA